MQYNYLKDSNNRSYTDTTSLLPQTYFIPFWIDKVIVQNKLNYKDIFEYDRIRKFFSLDDLVELYSCYGVISKSGNTETSNQLEYSWWLSLRKEPNIKSKELRMEFEATILPLLNSASINTKIVERLNSNKPVLEVKYDETFDIVKFSDRSIVVKMKPGFIETLAFKEGKKVFLRKYLEALYTFSPIHEVSMHPAFNEFVKTLQE